MEALQNRVRYSLMGLIVVVVSLGYLLFLGGCAQNTPSSQGLETRQEQVSPTDQAAAGSQTVVRVEPYNVVLNLYPNQPGGGGNGTGVSGGAGALAEDGGLADTAGADPATLEGTTASPFASSAGGVRGSNAFGSISISQHVNTTSGGSSTGPQTAGGAAGQASTPTGTQTPTVTQRPEANLSTPVGVALPGGSVQQNASTSRAGDGGTSSSTLTPTQQAEARAILARLAGGTSTAADVARLAELLLPPTTSQPILP